MIITELKQQVYNKYNGLCAYTGKPLEDDWQIDHIKPKRQGGGDDFENLLPALKIVNHYKRGYDLEGFRKYMMNFYIRLKRLPKSTKSEKTRKRILYLQKISQAFDISEDAVFNGKFYFEKYNNRIDNKE